MDGIPLARQEKIWKWDGIALSRAAMANWVIQTAQSWLKPVSGSKLAEAVAYARDQKLYLNAFLEHGEVEISNNLQNGRFGPLQWVGLTGI